jgi:hypothetical protein
MCVLSNAVIIKACLPDARIVVNHKLVASPNKEMHQKAMDILKNIHIDVV